MAVRLADYYQNHLKRVGVVSAGALFVSTLLFSVVLHNFRASDSSIIPVMFYGLIIYGLAVAASLAYALYPLKAISQAITHISPQSNDTTPPNINQPYYENTGLRDMILTIYTTSATHPEPINASASKARKQVADILPCGVVGMNASRQIIYANERAPVTTNSRGDQIVRLIFNKNDSLDAWLTQAEASKVTDIKFWADIPDNEPDRPERRLYDVVAMYEKNSPSGLETRIISIDRTQDYRDNQDDVDFISVAAHELRGPITVIRGYIDVIMEELRPQLSPDQQALIDRLDVSASRLGGYVSNILNVSRFDRKHLQLHLKEDSMADIVGCIAYDLNLRARTQHRLLSINIPNNLPTIAADRSSMTEVISNLVDNAIKYSYEGGLVEVTAKIDGSFIQCAVKDHGIGVPTAVAANLFQKFYRSHRSSTNVGGTGLGLYISRAIVESHGGKIGVMSKEGEGATFTFSVPIYSTVADKLAASHNKNQAVMNVSNPWISNHSKVGS